MVNAIEFKVAMLRNDITVEELSKKIGISKASLSYKVNGKREFSRSEIEAITDILNLSLEDKERIFFGHNVENNSTS